MTDPLQVATKSIFSYAYGMDTGDWELALAGLGEAVDVDYSSVGGPKARMTKQDLKGFLHQLLGKPDLRVHTAVSQVFENPKKPSNFVAYYSVRHYKGQLGQAIKFAVFGWYDFTVQDDLIVSLNVNVTALEGDSAVLA